MSNTLENKDGLYELLGIPETSVLVASPGDVIIVKVDKNCTPDQMWAHGNRVKEILPNNPILVIPRNVDLSYFDKDYAKQIAFATVRD
jgi:hypothetical protein